MRRGDRAERGPLVPVALLGLFVVGLGLILGTIVAASAGGQGGTQDGNQRNRDNSRHVPTASPTSSPSPTPSPTSSPTPSPTLSPTPTLDEAIRYGLVQAQIVGEGPPGDGNSTGDVINIGLTRTGPKRLEIELPRGTVLRSETWGFQDMVVQAVKGETSGPTDPTYFPVSRIVLDDNEEQWFVVEAYCLDLSGDNPEYGTDFNIEGTTTPEVLAVLKAAAEIEPDASTTATQIAIWAVNEDASRARVQSRFRVDEEDFAEARAILVAAGMDPASTRMFD